MDKKTAKEFEELKKAVNDPKEEVKYLFAIEKKKGTQIVANASDKFMYCIVTQILSHHPNVMKVVVNDLLNTAVEMTVFKKLKNKDKH